MNNPGAEWDECLPYVLWAYRGTVHKTTGFYPCQLLFRKYITTLDLSKGYHQVPMNKEHIERTAFITPYGKYEFLTMPFGLITDPSTFQRLMDKILHGLHEFAVVTWMISLDLGTASGIFVDSVC